LENNDLVCGGSAHLDSISSNPTVQKWPGQNGVSTGITQILSVHIMVTCQPLY
jgi:hypothetical protein